MIYYINVETNTQTKMAKYTKKGVVPKKAAIFTNNIGYWYVFLEKGIQWEVL